MAVAALSSQTRGAGAMAEPAPQPLLVAHGTADEVLPNTCAMDIRRSARAEGVDPVNSGCRHSLA